MMKYRFVTIQNHAGHLQQDRRQWLHNSTEGGPAALRELQQVSPTIIVVLKPSPAEKNALASFTI